MQRFIVVYTGILLSFFNPDCLAQKNPKKSAKVSETVMAEQKQRSESEEWNDYFEISSELILGNYVSGLAKTMGFVKKYPQNAAGHIMLGDFYLKNNHISGAVESYKNGIKHDNTEKWYSLKLAHAYQSASMYKEAVDVYESMFKNNSQDPSPLFYVFQIYYSRKFYKEAAEVLEKIRGSVGDSYEISADLQRTYFKAKNYKASLKELELLKKMRPDDAENYGKTAEIYLMLGQEEKAINEYEQVLRVNPNDEQIHFSLASFYSNRGAWEKSIYHLKKGIGNSGIDIDQKVLILLSLTEVNYKKNGMYTDSIIQMLDVLTEVHPGSAKAYSVKGDFYMSIYDYEKAVLAFEEVIRIDKEKWAVWAQCLYIYRLLENYDRLYVLSSEAEELYPNNPQVYLYKGIAAMYLGKDAQSFFESGEVMLFEPGPLASAFEVGRAEKALLENVNQEAETAFRKALKTDAFNQDAMLKWAYSILQNNGNVNEADSLISKASSGATDLFYFYACKGLLHLQKNNRSEAEKMLTLAEKFGGAKHSWTLELKGDLLYLDQKKEDALAAWIQARDKGIHRPHLEAKIKKAGAN